MSKINAEKDAKLRNAAIASAKDELNLLTTAGHDRQILGAKAMEVGLRLAVQLTIVGLHELGNSYSKISSLLDKKGYKISSSQLSKLALGTHTPNPAILPALIQV